MKRKRTILALPDKEDYQDPRWIALSCRRMEMDGFACVSCGNDSIGQLLVHHPFYYLRMVVVDGEAFFTRVKCYEVSIEDLRTQCTDCHGNPRNKAGVMIIRDSARDRVLDMMYEGWERERGNLEFITPPSSPEATRKTQQPKTYYELIDRVGKNRKGG